MALGAFGPRRFVRCILCWYARRMAVGASHSRLHLSNLMHQVELVFDRITCQSFWKPARFPLGRRPAFPGPLMVDHGIANCPSVWDAECAAGPLSILYCIGVVVAARADPVRYKGRTHIWPAVLRMAIDAAHSLSVVLIIQDRLKAAGRMA